ncbi:HlyD family secretion protein [Mucilaginibacter gilvus]|uniref:HlyD family secretion protein n=1 Tax=Mucilaginibacter gilvus TaxID=2305909 RepID=UPI001FBB583C|nr:HlyD family efflux transporter periplasmic adaptor subunit [Mucilaginibacter gilvus]
MFGLSALIKYPDIVETQLKIASSDMPKQVVSKVSGKLVKLLVINNEEIKANQPLAYLESTASHDKVLQLLIQLEKVQARLNNGQAIDRIFFDNSSNCELGELQGAYLSFAKAYLTYRSFIENGLLIRKRAFLQKDILLLNKQEQQKVKMSAKLRTQERKYLCRKASLLHSDAEMITSSSNLLAKRMRILELDDQANKECSKLLQALNSLIDQVKNWKSNYVLSASQAGKVSFAGIIQRNQIVTAGQVVFYINAGPGQFFGEMIVPQNNLGKVKKGQEVLVKLKSYPFEEYGMLQGKISYISDVPYRDSIFISKVEFKSNIASDLKKTVTLKQGMIADAEIITQDATLFQRLTRNIIKVIDNK